MASWTIPLLRIEPPKTPMALADLVPLLERLVSAFGTSPITGLLDVDENIVEALTSRRQNTGRDLANRGMGLHEVMTRQLQIYQARKAMDWLVGNDPYLNYARQSDVLVSQGSAPLLEALEAIDSGGFA